MEPWKIKAGVWCILEKQVAYAVSEAVLWEACDLVADALVLTLLVRYFCVCPFTQGDFLMYFPSLFSRNYIAFTPFTF